MVVFENGRPLKSNYRKFALKTVTSPDDYAAMREVMQRRLDRYFEEQGTETAFARLPDLILLDGGKGQVSAVLPVLDVYKRQDRSRLIERVGGGISILPA